MKRGLYIHIPFCAHKCGYCDFTSFVPKRNDIDEYISMLEVEFELYSKLYNIHNDDISTIFIGGGTPSILSKDQLTRLFNIINKFIKVSGVVEYTVECNPGTLSIEKLHVMKNSGVNRLSIGLQAIQEKHLRFMERIHSLKEFDESLENARSVGFENINVDLIYAFDGQSMDDWKESLDCVISKKIEHLSCYSLIIEENTAFYDRFVDGELKEFDENNFVKMYRYTVETLRNNGYNQYEISNYAKKDRECKHNINYWECGEYYGLGLGASGFINKKRYTNYKVMKSYIESVKKNEIPIYFEEKITKIDMYNEKVMLGLRTEKGIDEDVIFNIENLNIRKTIKKNIEKYLKKGYIKICKENNSSRINLTQKGKEISNTIIVDLMM